MAGTLLRVPISHITVVATDPGATVSLAGLPVGSRYELWIINTGAARDAHLIENGGADAITGCVIPKNQPRSEVFGPFPTSGGDPKLWASGGSTTCIVSVMQVLSGSPGR